MTIAVVIPSLDEGSGIAEAVECARASGAPSGAPSSQSSSPLPDGDPSWLHATSVEVVVVDGGSRDATVQRAQEAGAIVLQSAPGRARQLQAGVEASSSEFVLFLHADTRLPSGWQADLRRALADPTVVGGAFRLRFDRRSPALRIVEWGARLRVALFALPYGDQAIFVRRRVLEEMGGVPQTSWMEDLDLVSAMKRRGRIVVLRSEAVTSARRHVEGGVLLTACRHLAALSAWALGCDRERIATWIRR